METPPWYVLTGGPCAGKTTLLTELARRGYRTVPEAARAHIDEHLAHGNTLEEIRRDEVAFQRALIRRKLDAEKVLPRGEVIFFDRGMHDSEAYLEVHGITNDAEVTEALAHTQYRKAFLLDLMPFEKDAARTETPEEAQAIHEALRASYERAGIPVMPVSVLPISARADFVLAHL